MKTKKILFLLVANMIIISSFAQIGKCKGKYLGNIVAYSVPSNYTSLWNQTTSENGSKWGSCDRGNGVYDFGNSDLAYNTAKNSGGAFKFHALIWGAQAPSYLANAQASTIVTAIRNWYQAVQDHYAPMGGLDFIDVLNEPVNTPINRDIANLKAALTMGYQSEAANQGDLNNAYGWAIWPFQLARKHFPNATLLINEFNIEMNWNNCRAEYIKMSNAIKNAPNLTDGQKNIIDGIGLQAHGIENLTANNFRTCLDQIWNETGLPMHITEIDIVADPNEELQRSQYAALLPIAWEHPHVAGITLWGYVQGSTWRPGNGVMGAGGTDSGIQYSNLTDRPAMTWIKQYFASQPSLACCPDPAPFANCDNGVPPTVSFNSPTETAFIAPATITFDVDVADADGTISNVFYYLNDVLIQEEWVAPYAFDYTINTAGAYTVKAVATDNDGNEAEDIISISVNVPQGPYSGTPAQIPGKIEFENFDVGGNGFAYYDVDAGTNVDPAPNFRTDEDVDIETCSDVDGGYNLGWTAAGEWTEYTVNVQTSGIYDMVIRVACNGDDRTISLTTNGVAIASDVAIPNTADWQTWVDVTISDVQLQAGEQVLRMTIGATDYVNLNYMTFALVENGPEITNITPPSGSEFTTNDIVQITVEAQSTTATITNVEIFDGTTSLGSDNGAPYQIDWSPASEGVYTLTVQATDNNGQISQANVTYTIVQGPTIIELHAGWNLIGCPIDGSTNIEDALASVWQYVNTVKNADKYWYIGNTIPIFNTLQELNWGEGYLIKVSSDCSLTWE